MSTAYVMRRQEPRARHQLSVWVSGSDKRGQPFKQTSTVIEVSRLGGRLSEIQCLRAPGDVIEIKHRGKKGRFRIVWIDDVLGQAGIRCIEPGCYIWGLKLPASGISEPSRVSKWNWANLWRT